MQCYPDLSSPCFAWRQVLGRRSWRQGLSPNSWRFSFFCSLCVLHKESIELLPGFGTLPLLWSCLCFWGFHPNSSLLCLLWGPQSFSVPGSYLMSPPDCFPSAQHNSDFRCWSSIWIWAPESPLDFLIILVTFSIFIHVSLYFSVLYPCRQSLLFILSSTHVELESTLLQNFPSCLPLAIELAFHPHLWSIWRQMTKDLVLG